MKRCLFIPTFNVAASVGSVLRDLAVGPAKKFDKILIIDNCSGDDTIAVCRRVILAHKVLAERTELWRNSENYSLGGSTVIAIEKALSLRMDYLVNLHSDGQASAQDVGRLADKCGFGFPLVLGSRLVSGSENEEYGLLRLWGNRFFARWQKFILGREVSDLGALMALPLSRLEGVDFKSVPSDMGYQPLLLMKLIAANREMEVIEIPIAWGKVEFSNVNPFAYGLRHFWRLLRFNSSSTQSQMPKYTSEFILLSSSTDGFINPPDNAM